MEIIKSEFSPSDKKLRFLCVYSVESGAYAIAMEVMG